MNETPSQTHQLLDELRQICSQYSKEVPGRRRPWPRSIRERVIALRRARISFGKISEASGISLQTMYSWKLGRETRGAFLPVRVAKKPRLQPSRLENRKLRPEVQRDREQPSTVTVVLSTGLRIEGLDFGQAVEAARRLS
jgi:hypothetical protein